MQTIAPKFTGRFNKGVDYVGDLAQFEKEFRDDLAVIAFAVQKFGLPANLKLSVHSGSDKFSLYPIMRRALRETGAGLHLKTAGTTWLEEVIGLAEAGGDGLALAKEIYAKALAKKDELCAAVRRGHRHRRREAADRRGRAAAGRRSSSSRRCGTTRRTRRSTRRSVSCVHVGFKIAAQMGERYLSMLKTCEATHREERDRQPVRPALEAAVRRMSLSAIDPVDCLRSSAVDSVANDSGAGVEASAGTHEDERLRIARVTQVRECHDQSLRPQGEVAVVFGGTGVLGGAMAEALAGAGAKVVVVGRSAERGTERVRAIEKAGGDGRLPAGRRDEPRVARRGAATRSSSSSARSPCSSTAPAATSPKATIAPGGDFCKMPLEGWEAVFDLNLVGGALLPCQIFGETMVAAGKGSIINIASMSSILPLSRVVAYSASKAAVLNLTQWLAREWATKGVRVNAISPGFFPAEQNRRMLLKDDGTYTERGQSIIGHTPMGRFGDAEELAGAVIWLASSKASRLRDRPEHRGRWRLLVGDDLIPRKVAVVKAPT